MIKDTVYYELLESMKDDCCPVCTLTQKRMKKIMEAFLYESANNPSVRQQIVDARGLCNYHSNMLQSMGDPLSHAILYGNLIKIFLNDIPVNKNKKLTEKYKNHQDCFFCTQAKQCEITYSKSFYYCIQEEEFRKKYEQSGMLCVSHFNMITEICQKKHDKTTFELIDSITRKKYNTILKNLKEIERKSDYRFTSEKWTDEEKSSWKKAVGIINDKAGTRK